jgi:TolB-like protein
MSEEAPESGGGQPPTDPVPNASLHVFISYASQDIAVANVIAEALERHGLKCWIAPRDVTPGEFYADAIVRALNAARTLVLVLTENAATSQHVLREVERTSAKRHSIISFRIGFVSLPPALEYFLSASHWLDASASGVDSALPKLVDAVRRAVALPPVSIPAHVSDTATRVVDPSSAPRVDKKSSQQLRRPVVAIITVIAVIVAYLVVDKFWLTKRFATERPAATVATVAPASPVLAAAVSEKSVAVLPFVDMSEKKDQEYFSDGLTEELIDKLTKVPDLRVPARTSSFYFKGKSEDIPTIARRLLVAHVLEGSVRKSGMYLRITAQLVRADNGYHLWSQTYDRKLDDIFKVQDEIAGAVVSALKVSLGDSSTLKVTTPKNTEAYTLYLQGRAINRIARNKAELDSAAEYMRKAIKADPTFAAAWAWLAIVLGNEVNVTAGVRGDAVAAEMRRATKRALALDPNLSTAHAANGWTYGILDWDWEAAAAEYQKAYDLDPTDAGNAQVLGNALWVLHGESDTVLVLFQKGIELDPVSYNCYGSLGQYYMGTGKLPEAETAYRKAIDLGPTVPDSHIGLGTVLLLRGEAAAALAEFQRDSNESEQRQGAAMAYFALGRRAEADAALSEMERLDATPDAASIAETLALRGESDQAFAWLDRAYQQRDPLLPEINRDPLLKSLHVDRRWKAFLGKMKLPE